MEAAVPPAPQVSPERGARRETRDPQGSRCLAPRDGVVSLGYRVLQDPPALQASPPEGATASKGLRADRASREREASLGRVG